MNSENNSNSLFNKLPVSILSKAFVLAQNPQLSLLNKNMHYASQQVDTISKYIVKYTLSNTETSLEYNISTVLENYTRINMNETIGILVFRKIKKIDYEIALEMAIKYKWKNVLNKLLRMYVAIDRNTSTVVYKDILFMNEGEYLDIDIGNMFSEENEFQRDFTNINISENLYARPVITTHSSLQKLLIKINREFEKEDVEALIDSWDSKIEIPTEFTGSVVTDVKFIDSKAIRCYMLSIVKRCCNLNSLESMKRILDLNININFSFQELKSYISCSDILESIIPTYFIKKYGYKTKMELLTYITCSYHSIDQNKKELIKYLEDNYPDTKYQQILFDAAIYNRNESLVKEYFFKVESNSENIGKVTSIACLYDNLDIIRSLLNNSDKLKGDLDENALKTAIKKKDYELVKDIITKYPNAASISCLEEAMINGHVRIIKQLIESGIDLKSNEFEGIKIAINIKDINMLQLLLENGTPVELVDENDTKGLCSIKNCKIAKRLLEFSDKDKVKSKIPESQAKVETRLEFNKIMLCLIEVLRFYDACQSYDSYGYDYYYYYGDYEDFEYEENDYILDFDEFCENLYLYEGVMVFMSSKKKDIANALELYFDDLPRSYESNEIDRILYDKLVEIIGYVIENRLQSTFDGTENDETNGLRNENNIEILNDRHYELAKLELVNRNFGMLKLLIEYGLDVNSHDSLILKTAYKAGDIDWIDYFISKGAKLKERSDGFEEACKSDKVDVLKYWIKNGGVVPKDPEYECINMACLLGNFDMVKLLVENGVDLSDPTRNGVRIACRLGLKRTLKYLLDNNAVIDGVRHHQLEHACMTENIGLVKTILEYYDSLGVLEKKDKTDTNEGESLDFSHFDNENTDRFKEYSITKTLLGYGEHIQNIDLLNGIKAAVAVINIEILRLLLKYKIDLDNCFKLINFAVKFGNTEMVELLLENGLSVKDNSDIVGVALEAKNVEIIGLLLRHGAKIHRNSDYLMDVNLDDNKTLQLMLTCCPEIGSDSYLLQASVEKNKIDAAKLLLKDTFSLKDSKYNYILQAYKCNNIEMVKLLFEKGAKIREGSESGVIQACENKNMEMLKLLFEKDPSLVLNQNYGLKEAIEHKNLEIIKLLVKNGADTSEHIQSITSVANKMNDRDLVDFCQSLSSRD